MDSGRPAGDEAVEWDNPAELLARAVVPDDHHAELTRMLLDQIDALTTQIGKLTNRIEELIAAIPAAQGARGTPKSKTGVVEAIRALKVARSGAIKARTQAGLQLRDLVLTAPAELRAKLGPLTTEARVAAAARLRPGATADPVEATKLALAAIARRHQHLTAEIDRYDATLAALVERAAPDGFLDRRGVGEQSAAALLVTVGDNPKRIASEAGFAALTGASPVDASSGKQRHHRHRLNRGGDRQANSALWRIVTTRMRYDPRTKAYVARRTAEGKNEKEIIRCLKRYVAREVYKALVRTQKSTAAADTNNNTPDVGQDAA